MAHLASKPTRMLALGFGLALLTVGSGQAAAQHDPQRSMQQHAMPSHAQAAASPADRAYQAAMERMQHDMPMDLTGDADVDFARGMIPHHQGAIDMARAVLQYGDDPKIKKLALDIIAAQEREIGFLRDWLESKGRNPG
ncbi:MAG: CopM family metallochaperone [Geminicoccales bacterium]